MIESILTVEAWRLGLAPMLLRKSSLSFEVFPRLEGKSPPSVNFAQQSYNEKISKIIATGEIPSSSCKIRFFCFLVFFLAGVLGILNSSVAHPNRCLALEGKLASQSKWCFGHKHKKVRYLDSCNGESVDSPRFPHCPSANYLWPALSDSWVRCQSQNLWEPFLKKWTGVISTTWKITLKQECLNPIQWKFQKLKSNMVSFISKFKSHVETDEISSIRLFRNGNVMEHKEFQSRLTQEFRNESDSRMKCNLNEK